MLFRDGADLLDFNHFVEVLHNVEREYNPEQVEKIYKDYDALRDVYTRCKDIQKHYENHDQGFRDFLKNNCLTEKVQEHV